ncbi:glycosyltransferase family 4 protein [candidate division KSB1 bacterium]|nr:glycosyltransferase family 4 protein [candidate division KSB1 bacterium]
MRILFLAPHPFYQDRGTPIAVKLMLQTLSERGEEVDLLTYHEGKEVSYPNICIHRIANLGFVRNVRPGFSWKKVICDFFMFLSMCSMLLKKRYDIVHAVEESAFMAIFVKMLIRIPYIYDMDSSMAQQIVEKSPSLKPISRLLDLLEGVAVKKALAVMPVCEALADIALTHDRNKKVLILHDVPLSTENKNGQNINIGNEIETSGLRVVYVGNLEPYQGIDLLLKSFQMVLAKRNSTNLVIVGGMDSDIQKYKSKCKQLGIAEKVHFVGQRPIDNLEGYLQQADILVSPRITGKNTPMKIYSYLQSGKAVLATNIYSHTQLLNDQVAAIAEPTPEAFSDSLLQLVEDGALRMKIGAAGKRLVEQQYSLESFKEKVNDLYDWVERNINN